jgi:hypothetical protein
MNKLIVLVSSILVSSILLVYPHNVLAINTVVKLSSLGLDQADTFESKVLDLCLPFPYHVNDTVSISVNGTAPTVRLSCALELSFDKDNCLNGDSQQQFMPITCGDPRYTNFLVHDVGTPPYQESLARSSNSSFFTPAQHQAVADMSKISGLNGP